MKSADAIATNAIASARLIAPRGSSRIAVRGLSASIRASTTRLKPIAALRAATIATRIQPTVVHVTCACRDASSAPARANGSAKTEWLNRTNDAYVRRRFSISLVERGQGPAARETCWRRPVLANPCDLTRHDPADQIFFHIVDIGREPDGDERRALAGLD